eukprot:4734125-Alexandrium_andersonii.AAC.2
MARSSALVELAAWPANGAQNASPLRSGAMCAKSRMRDSSEGSHPGGPRNQPPPPASANAL